MPHRFKSAGLATISQWTVSILLSMLPSLCWAASYEVIHEFVFFDKIDGFSPSGRLIIDSTGRVCGTTPLRDSRYGGGSIYCVTPGGALETIHLFDVRTGVWGPTEGLVMAPDGKAYGTTSSHIFSVDLTTRDFESVQTPVGIAGLTVGPDSKIYGTSYYAPGTPNGAIVSFDPTTATYNIIHRFNETDGSFPSGRPIFQDGKLIGTAPYGGIGNRGTIFECNFDGSEFRVLKLSLGARPTPGLTADRSGRFWGTVSAAHYKIDNERWTGRGGIYEALAEDDGTRLAYRFRAGDGTQNYHYWELTLASDGWLWGVTLDGGLDRQGLIYRFDPSTGAYEQMFDFRSTDLGFYPSGPLKAADDGSLYGVAQAGGLKGGGVLFRIVP